MVLLKYLFRNIFRHKLRSTLTVLSVSVAVLSFCLLNTIITAWYAGVSASSSYRLIVRNAISLVFSLPLSYKEKIRQVKGVTYVAQGNWFGGIYIEEKNFFANFAVEPETFLRLYPEFIVKEEEKKAFLSDRKGCLVGRKLIERFGWKVGDIVVLRGTIFPGNWEFVIRGIYYGKDKNVDESQFLFHWDYLNETLKKFAPSRADQVGYYIVGIKNPEDSAVISKEIDSLFKNSYAETLTETEKAFQLSFITMTEAIVIAIKLVSFVVIGIILVVVANTMNMSVRERRGEYSILKMFGFSYTLITSIILGESLLIVLTGAVLGVIFTFPAVKVVGDILSVYFPVFILESKVIFESLMYSFVVGILSGIIPAIRSIRVDLSEGLRWNM
ncbi:MAG: FtsX-like permease family protein [Proteobacteria bacterium]|nr:FtsX-like permease family protein [Pseudomonadota bacterium]